MRAASFADADKIFKENNKAVVVIIAYDQKDKPNSQGSRLYNLKEGIREISRLFTIRIISICSNDEAVYKAHAAFNIKGLRIIVICGWWLLRPNYFCS